MPAPLRSHAKTGDAADTSGHAERYTKALPQLSPVPSPAILSSSNQATPPPPSRGRDLSGGWRERRVGKRPVPSPAIRSSSTPANPPPPPPP